MIEWSAGHGACQGFHSILAPLILNTGLGNPTNEKRTPLFSRTRSNPEAKSHSSIRRDRKHQLQMQSQKTSGSRLILSSPIRQRDRRRATTASASTVSTRNMTSPSKHHSANIRSHSLMANTMERRQKSVSYCAHDENCLPPSTTLTASRQGGTERTSSSSSSSSCSSVKKENDCQLTPRSHLHYSLSPVSSSSSSLSLSRSPSFDSAYTRSSPFTSLPDRIEEPSSDCDYSDMVDAQAGSSGMSPLAYKRKGGVTSLERSSVKKRRQDKDSSKTMLFPEVVITPKMASPWSKGKKSGSTQESIRRKEIEIIVLSDSDEDEDDDNITLLPTLKSMKEYTASESSYAISSSPTLPKSSPSIHRTPHRNPIQKLMSLVEDIFEAETDATGGDGITAPYSMPKRAKSFFTMQDNSPPILKVEKICLLKRLALACPSSRGVTTEAVEMDGSLPLHWSEMDSQEWSRMIKIMHRGMDAAAGLDPFPLLNLDRKQTSPLKKKRGTKKQGVSAADENDTALLTEAALEETKSKLSRIAYSSTVADSCLSILGKDGTNKVLLCEEMILPCLYSIKTALEIVVIPFVKACSEGSCSNLLLDEFISAIGSTETSTNNSLVSACADHLGAIFSSLISSLPQLQAMLKKRGLVLSDTMAFILANSLLPIFFLLDPEAGVSTTSSDKDTIKLTALASLHGGKTPLKSLRLSAIHVLRLTYERNEEQKDYIMTSILDSMQSLQDIRKQARRQHGLANGKAICSSTALLLQIIQASSHSTARAKKITEIMDWEDAIVSTPQEDETNVESDVYRVDLLREGQKLARRAATEIAQCLMHKIEHAGIAKATKNVVSSESGFASMMESLVADLLDTLCCPEWPASSLLLSELCAQFCTYLEKDNGSHDVRSIALDQLSLMAKRWGESKISIQSPSLLLSNVNTLLESRDVEAMKQLNRAYWIIIASFKQNMDDQGLMEGAARFLEAQWGREMMLLLFQCNDLVISLRAAGEEEEEAEMSVFLREIDTLIGQMVLASDSPEQIRAIIQSSNDTDPLSVSDTFEALIQTFAYGARFNIIEGHLINASNGPNATNRNKAVRGLGYLSEINSNFLQQEHVMAAVQRCLFDESVNVRDTAVGLLGKFALSNSNHLLDILPSLKLKMEDKALLIRKRTLRLFKDLYDCTTDDSLQVIAAVEIVRSVFDEEKTLRDLVIESTAQLWFGISGSSTLSGKNQGNKTPNGKATVKQLDQEENEDETDWQDAAERGAAQSRLCNIVQVAKQLRVKPSPVQEVLQRMVKKSEGKVLEQQMAQLVALTIDNIVESQQASLEPVEAELLDDQVEVIALFVQTNPLTLSIRKAKQLLPYLKRGHKDVDTRLLKNLLNIFSSCLPIMASTAVSFASQLQYTLTPLVSKPSDNYSVIEELIKCYCTVIRSHTHDYRTLIGIMQMCYQRIQKFQDQEPIKDRELCDAKVLITVTSLLVENADYDAIRREHSSFADKVDDITRRNVSKEVAETLVTLLEMEFLRVCVLQSLRYVCRGFPKLMTSESLGGIMQSILKQGTLQDKYLVLRIVADIMERDSCKYDADQIKTRRDMKKNTPKKVEREELAGESESQTSSPTFEIAKQYGGLVQKLAVQVPLQKIVLDIIEVIILQGICHPLEFLSTLVSLQTVTKDKWISNKAQGLHRHLISKNATNVSVRYAQHALEAWKFQCTRNGTEVSGCSEQGEALFETWYKTLKEQKKTQSGRMDHLKALVKAFNVDTSTEACSQDNVHYARFIAENLAALNYKTVEEVVCVASEVHNILTVAGEQVQIYVQEEVPVDGEEDDEEEDENEEMMNDETSKRPIIIGRMSTIMSMAIRLLIHLREQYGLKESQIARGYDKKASNVAAIRKSGITSVFTLDDLPGALQRREGMALAKKEMNLFDNMLNCEGIGATDYDSDDD